MKEWRRKVSLRDLGSTSVMIMILFFQASHHSTNVHLSDKRKGTQTITTLHCSKHLQQQIQARTQTRVCVYAGMLTKHKWKIYKTHTHMCVSVCRNLDLTQVENLYNTHTYMQESWPSTSGKSTKHYGKQCNWLHQVRGKVCADVEKEKGQVQHGELCIKLKVIMTCTIDSE